MEALAAEIRALATEFIASPDGADPPARAAAVRRVEDEVRELDSRLGRARERVGALRAEYGQFTPQDRSLEPYGKPASIEHGEELIVRAQADLETAKSHLEEVARDAASAPAAGGRSQRRAVR